MHVDNFDQFVGKAGVKDGGGALVMFYAPWCGHCTAAKPEFARASTVLADNDGDGNGDGSMASKLAAVDCTLNNEVCDPRETRDSTGRAVSFVRGIP